MNAQIKVNSTEHHHMEADALMTTTRWAEKRERIFYGYIVWSLNRPEREPHASFVTTDD